MCSLYVSRWSGIIAVVAPRALASSLLELLETVAPVAGEAPGRKVLRLDLADSQNVDHLLELIKVERDKISMIYLSLPSGTASASRGKHLDK